MNNDLKKLITEEGVTQVELASASGVATGTINKLCNDKRDCALTTLYRIVKALNKLADREYSFEQVFPNNEPAE